jgi:hypothetical protein
MYINRICAWCQAHLGKVKCKRPDMGSLTITHSICPECREKLLKEMEQLDSQSSDDQKQNTKEWRL